MNYTSNARINSIYSINLFASFAHFFENIIMSLSVWNKRINERHHLRELSDYHLKDVGLTRSEILTETRKLFWQV